MTLFEIPVGFASVFMMILVGYFVLTVWFGSPQAPVVQKAPVRVPEEPKATLPSELNAG